MMSRAFTKKGEARKYCWLKVTSAYAILIGTVGLTTYQMFNNAFFPNGLGSLEYVLIGGYALLYAVAVFIGQLIVKNKKKA